MNSKLFTNKNASLPSSRFTLKEWYLYNKEQISTSLDQQQLGLKILAECDKVQDAFEEKAKLNKREVDFKTEQKIKDSEFNKAETLRHRKEVCCVIDNLISYNNRVNSFWNYVQDKAIPIAKKCIEFREGRIGIDLCRDEVEQELRKEYQMMQDALPLLRNVSEQSTEQIRQLRSSLYFIDRDLEDKDAALNIDKSNLQLSQYSLRLCLYHGLKPLDSANISIDEWDTFSREIVKKAAKEITGSYKLQSDIDFLLSKLVRELSEQYNLVNESFQRRIIETKEIKLKLETRHGEIVGQAKEMTCKIIEIKKSFGLKENFLALAHTRMGNRAQRSGIELCRDLVEANLVNEVTELRKNCDLLQLMISEVQASQRYLFKIQTKLEYDINVKTNTLKIDEVDCMTIRHGIDYHSY